MVGRLGDFLGDKLRSLIEYQRSIHVFLVVNAIWNQHSVFVMLIPFRPPTLSITIDVDADDFVWGQEAIGDALLQRVRVNGWTKVVDVGNFLGFLGRCR